MAEDGGLEPPRVFQIPLDYIARDYIIRGFIWIE